MNHPAHLVVLVSGSGSNLQKLIEATQNGALHAKIVAVISNNPDAFGLKRAEMAGIPAIALNHKDYDDRESYDRDLMARVEQFQPDLVILAGYMRILTAPFVRAFQGKLINIHPSLLPHYPGLHTHRRALAAGDTQHGATVHFVTEDLDGGPPILQATVPILSGDNETTLAQRVLKVEHLIYPLAVSWFIQGRLQMKEHSAWLDNELIGKSGIQYANSLTQESRD